MTPAAGAPALRRAAVGGLAVAWLLAWGAGPASAEPKFLSKQYPRCTACHYSPSGGGLLTPYGRSLSRALLSTFGAEGAGEALRGEEAALYGAIAIDNPLQLGLDMRPSHLRIDWVDAPPGFVSVRDNFLMNLDLQAAWREGRWTFYGTAGRAPEDGEFVSYEHWAAWQATDSVTVRGGRFLPAYGVRFTDHTSFHRAVLDLDQHGQVYGVEVGVSTDGTLLQVSVGPGHAVRPEEHAGDADALDQDHLSFTMSTRLQVDVGSRLVVAGSLLHRNRSDYAPRSTDTGLALGYAPTPWLTTWSHADVRFQRLGGSRRAYTVGNQTSIEVLRGLWIRLAPQLYWPDFYAPLDGRGRMAYGMDWFPRTHWHVNLSYYRDRPPLMRCCGRRTFLAQLHLYL